MTNVDPEDAAELSREALEGFLEFADEGDDVAVERALLALMDLKEHEVVARSACFDVLLHLFYLTLENVKTTRDYMASMNMVAERQMQLAPFVFEKVEETLATVLEALDGLGQGHDDVFLKLYAVYLKAAVEELVTGRPAGDDE